MEFDLKTTPSLEKEMKSKTLRVHFFLLKIVHHLQNQQLLMSTMKKVFDSPTISSEDR